jgi:hypothetical protein
MVTVTSCQTNPLYEEAIRRRPTSVTPEPENPDSLEAQNVMYWSHEWAETHDHTIWEITSPDGLHLYAYYFPAQEPTRNTVILAHGYTGCALDMSIFAQMYSEQFGCNILMPDARAHGTSDGAYICWGWHERLDYQQWAEKIIEKNGDDCVIILHGVSMGAATCLMAAGEGMPQQVCAVISDCSFTNLESEMNWLLEHDYHLKVPSLVHNISKYAQEKAGYAFEQVSPLEFVKDIHIPVLFIHGEQDSFIPLYMVNELYDACPAEKYLYTEPLAAHATSFRVNPNGYAAQVRAFLARIPAFEIE